MSIIDDAIIQRIDFLKQQLAGEDDPAYIRTWQVQIKVLQNTQMDKLDELIAIRRTDLKNSKNSTEFDNTFAELEALEWLQRRVSKQPA